MLGPYQVLLDDVPVKSLESAKVRALLAYLAVESEHTHSRESLIGLLWPDSPEESARHNLRQAIFNLRSALRDQTANPPYLIITRESIQFNRESDFTVDIDQFNRYFYDCEEFLKHPNGDPSITKSELEEMVKLFRGEFLQQFFVEDSNEFEEWCIVLRENFHQRALEGHKFLADYYEQQEDYQSARKHALRQLELDPWREEAHRQLMRVLALDGQRSSALAQYDTCRRILAKELDVEPSAETRELYEQIRQGNFSKKTDQAVKPLSKPVNNLPLQLTPFIGREAELIHLGELIADPGCRCITLIGPGGIGKTRLAVQTGGEHLNKFTHGAAFVPLASIGTMAGVIPAIANAVNYTFYSPHDPRSHLLNYLSKKQMLLILDNVEHLLTGDAQQEALPQLLIEILQRAPEIKLVITSREALNLLGEQLLEVQGLMIPESVNSDNFYEFDAIALFVQRAQRISPKFTLEGQNREDIAHICRLVEGMPLAIELAATWMRLLSPSEIADEIEHNTDFLSTTIHDLPERHRSIKVVFDRSWQMLSMTEQQVLCKLSVFRGGFQRQATEQVAGASLTTLSTLVNRSFLRRTARGRYDLHELIRKYAAEQFTNRPEEQAEAQTRHSHYYLTYLSQADSCFCSSAQKETLTELIAEMDNFRAAWDWAVSQGDFALIEHALRTFTKLYDNRGWYQECLDILDRTIHALEADLEKYARDRTCQVALSHTLACRAYISFRLTQVEQAQGMLERSLEIVRPLKEPRVLVETLAYLGLVMIWTGNYTRALELFTEGLEISTTIGDRWFSVLCLTQQANVRVMTGDSENGHAQLQSAVANWRSIGDVCYTAYALNLLSQSALALGHYVEARESLEECVKLNISVDDRWGLGLGYQGLGRVAQAQGQHAEAVEMYHKGLEAFTELGGRRDVARALAEMGRSLFALGKDDEAGQAWHKAFRIASETQGAHVALEALVGMARLRAKQGFPAYALELALNVMNNPACLPDTRNRATQLCAELQVQLSSQQVEEAVSRAQAKSFEVLVDEVLHQG